MTKQNGSAVGNIIITMFDLLFYGIIYTVAAIIDLTIGAFTKKKGIW
jgi:hypothetical protein